MLAMVSKDKVNEAVQRLANSTHGFYRSERQWGW